MKLFVAIVVASWAAADTIVCSATGVATCSSLNGPFCEGLGPGFAVPPPHARQNLDIDVEELAVIESEKNLKVEKVLKQYELQAAISEAAALEEEEDIILDIEMLLDESIALLNELEEDDDTSPMAGAFAFSSANGAFELLERMDGDELKEFFETALDEVLLSVEAALQELSPNAAQGVRTSLRQLKALKDYSTYKFQRLDESQLASIRHKFANHRLVELQQTFERLVIAGDAQDRQLAFETAVFLFQLAQEEAIESSKEAEADTTTAVSDVYGE
ncbi:hypothetical protein F441_17401 [Phytophthora nicotianae CJ01A1]|uniref:RxLR effector protein n=5 Tax=Phytophthora nicotianae TaxID=4792 RepID=V9EB78_PHYNI|nr:hypothetical protein F443_17533 [Phytophthora nicotianae P1569]ETK76572.1 hypothetical protein L915_17066 [Phytophthora nicotianae]ETO65066.1 hypothetical protein F444_17573 [Phytophthora nicotianae P1976]ETP06185.1 hypothetical protein F441_17401 [Phytophthora nicotianae CJ01A1]ETP34285.1 hypothetical protein F442_17387 [Phytophthora nicotianae P10297]